MKGTSLRQIPVKEGGDNDQKNGDGDGACDHSGDDKKVIKAGGCTGNDPVNNDAPTIHYWFVCEQREEKLGLTHTHASTHARTHASTHTQSHTHTFQ